MDFNPDTWGTVAEWVGSIGTTLAFLATFIVIRRDAKVRRIAQARRIVYTVETLNLMQLTIKGHEPPALMDKSYSLTNLSDEPIYDVFFLIDGANGQIPASKDVVLPGEVFSAEVETGVKAPIVLFRDNSETAWIRNVNGKIHTYNPKRLLRTPEAFH